MKNSPLPGTDSIRELAEYWDTHDLTEFQEELEEVREPVFARATTIKVQLDADEAQVVQQLAAAQGVSAQDLIRRWVSQQVTLEGAPGQESHVGRNGMTAAETK